MNTTKERIKRDGVLILHMYRFLFFVDYCKLYKMVVYTIVLYRHDNRIDRLGTTCLMKIYH